VFGMPREAIRLDAAAQVAPLGDVPREIMRAFARATRDDLAMV
jgi:chemotaxis response regulator CheB